jgi:TIR domain
MKVFISHGFDAADQDGHDALAWLSAALVAADPRIEPFYDRERLQPGYDWAQALHVWLEGCSAAVVFLSDRSVTRPWVRKESTILAWRRACQGPQAFQLQVVHWGAVADATLVREGYGPLGLAAWQTRRCSRADQLQPVVDQLAAHAGRLMGEVAAASPLDTLTRHLASRLAAVPQVADLPPLAQDISGSLPAWQPHEAAGLACARTVASMVVQNHYGQLQGLRGLMARLHQINLAEPSRRDVFQVLAPLWVDPASAAALRPSLAEQRPRPTRFVALPVQDKALTAFEAEMLVRRANPLPDDARIVLVGPPAAMDSDAVCAWVAQRVDLRLGVTLSSHLQDDAGGSREERLAQLRHVDYPVYVVLRFAVDLGLAEELEVQLPGFTYLCLVPQAIDPLPGAAWSQVDRRSDLDHLRARAAEHESIKSAYGF